MASTTTNRSAVISQLPFAAPFCPDVLTGLCVPLNSSWPADEETVVTTAPPAFADPLPADDIGPSTTRLSSAVSVILPPLRSVNALAEMVPL